MPAAPPRSPAARALRGHDDAEALPAAPYHHGNLRQDLILHGKEMLRSAGLAELSLRRLAAAVGVSQVAPAHHFGNKEGLLAAIAADGFRDLRAYRVAQLKPGMDARQRLRSLLLSYVRFATRNPALFQLMFAPQFKTPELYGELDRAGSESYGMVAAATRDYLRDAGMPQVNPDEAARVAWMSVHGVATLILENRINPIGASRISPGKLAENTLDVVFAGLSALRADAGD